VFGYKLSATEVTELCDLLFKMLTYFPGDRISADEALAHPYFEVQRQHKRRRTTNTGNYHASVESAMSSLKEFFKAAWRSILRALAIRAPQYY
jgi:serine/threonine protein kinase